MILSFPISESCQIKNLNEIYLKYFGFPEDTRNFNFVEVGASDGYSHSNTWGLAEIGWNGLYIEPVPELAMKCRENHLKNSVRVLEIAIGSERKRSKLYLGPSPTINEETVNRNPWNFQYDRNKFIEIEVFTLTEILKIHQYSIHSINLLVIDVEGAEIEVLNGLNFELFRPYMIIIETHEQNKDKNKRFHCNQINSILDREKYSKIQADEINSIFVTNLTSGDQ